MGENLVDRKYSIFLIFILSLLSLTFLIQFGSVENISIDVNLRDFFSITGNAISDASPKLFSDPIAKIYDSNSVYLWEPSQSVGIKSLALSGQVHGTGQFKAFLISGKNSYLIASMYLDNETINFSNYCQNTCKFEPEINQKYMLRFIVKDVEVNISSVDYSEGVIEKKVDSVIEEELGIQKILNKDKLNKFNLKEKHPKKHQQIIKNIYGGKTKDLKVLLNKKEDLGIQSENNVYDAELELDNLSVSKIEFNDLVIENNTIELGLEDLNNSNSVQAYAINPTKLNFTSAIVNSKAKGNVLYKCKTWNFTERTCDETCLDYDINGKCRLSQGWKKLMNLVPGENYSFNLTSEDPAFAEYNSSFEAPFCDNMYDGLCIINSTLLECAGTQNSPGPEPNQPNTIDACTESGTVGTCRSDESIENITIKDLNDTKFIAGDTIQVNYTAWCWGTQDRVALYYTNSTSSINWKRITSGNPVCSAGGQAETFSETFVLENIGGTHAIRAINKYNSDITSDCDGASYTDYDDVVFEVHNVIYTNFSGQTTDFNHHSTPENVCNAILEIPEFGIIKWNNCINVSNQNFDKNVKIKYNEISLNSSGLNPSINSSANLTFYNISYPYPLIYRDGILCNECDVLLNDENLTFNVSHFSSYSAGPGTNISIWDDTDTEVRYQNQNTIFYANYTNITDNTAINSLGTYCEFSENSTGSWSSPVNMTFNPVSKLYEITKSFNNIGNYNFNISCFNDLGYANLSASDDFVISEMVRILGESGSINLSNFNGANITFKNRYTSTPIIIATPASQNAGSGDDDSSLIPLIESINTTGFEIKLCQDNGASTCDTTVSEETVHYFIFDVNASYPSWMDVGTQSSVTTNGADTAITFDKKFSNAPYVFTQSQTYSQTGTNLAAISWVDDVTTTGANLIGCTHEGTGDSCDTSTPSETMGWIAIDIANEDFSNYDNFQSGSNDISNSAWTAITWTNNYTNPRIMVTQNDDDGGQDPQYAWARGIETSTPDIRYCEQDGADYCDSHTSEWVMWFTMENGTISIHDSFFAEINIVSPKNHLITDQTTILFNVTTNKNATCEYSTNENFVYGEGTIFTDTGNNVHVSNLTGLSEGNYTYYVKCNTSDGYVNLNENQESVNFSIGNILYETGTINVTNITHVILDSIYSNPVIIVTGQQGADLGMDVEASRPIIANVTNNSFDVIVINDQGENVTEIVGYIVMEKGHYNIDGVEVEAGTYSVSDTGTQDIIFNSTFPSNTVVVDTIQEYTGEPITSRYTENSMTSSKYSVYWEEYNSNDWNQGTKTAGYIAVELGNGSNLFESGFYDECSADPGSSDWCGILFQNSYNEIPILFVNPVDSTGGDPTVVGRQNLNETGVDLRPTEDRVTDSEQDHAVNDLPWIVWTKIYGTDNVFPNTTLQILNSTNLLNKTNESLTCYAQGIDNQNSTLKAYYKWYNGTTLFSEGVTMGIINNVSSLVTTLDSSNTEKSETWTCSILFSDGELNETGWNNKSLAILNSIPTHTNPILNSTLGTNLTSENLTCYNKSTNDLDSDNVKNLYNWYDNGTSITVLNMPFEGGSNSSFTKDYSIYESNGNIVNAHWKRTSGYDGKGAYIFNRSNSELININEVNVDLGLTESFSYGAWFKANSIDNWGGILTRNTGSPNYDGYNLQVGSSEKISCFSGDSGVYRYTISNDMPVIDKWYFAVCVFNGSAMKLYVDGVLQNDEDTGITIAKANHDLVIGAFYTTPSLFFNGTIDDVFIYNRSLSNEQINALYHNNTDLIVSQETNIDENWSCEVIPNDGEIDGAILSSNDLIIKRNFANTPPNTTLQILNSTNLLNKTNESLTCYAQGIDNQNSTLKAYYKWYNGTKLFSEGVTTGITNDTISLVTTLDSSNTEKSETWTCSILFSDGELNETGWNNKSLTILNSLPSIPVLFAPATNFITVNRTQEVEWLASTDADNDNITYEVIIERTYCADLPSCTAAYFNITTDNLSAIPSTLDIDAKYNWSVRACDDEGCSAFSETRNFTVNSLIAISLPVNRVEFGIVKNEDVNDTTNDLPPPLIVQNDGNIIVNVTFYANKSLWSRIYANLNTSYFTFKIDNSSEANSFNYGPSQTTFTNVTDYEINSVADLDWENTKDSAEIDLGIKVPIDESPGQKQTNVYVVGK